jgi:hypothetical protein
MKIAIVGAEAKKFTFYAESRAKQVIATILQDPVNDVLVSGGCHLGGIDIWAEEYADSHDFKKIIHFPKKLQWTGGYKERNEKIAKDCDVLWNIVVRDYPYDYVGMQFDVCYHCLKWHNRNIKAFPRHVKSGGCWTAYKVLDMGKRASFLYLPQRSDDEQKFPSLKY